jgi:hypothetical protein
VSAPKTEFVLVTPEMATELLKHAPPGRPLSSKTVERFIEAIENGERLTSPIFIAVDGTLVDGQARLSAIVASGVSARMLLIRDVPLSALKTIDMGRRCRPLQAGP